MSLNSIIRSAFLAIAALLLVVTAAYFGWQLWMSSEGLLKGSISQATDLPAEHLIPNVPYRGQYLGTIMTNQEPVAVRTLMDYWNIPGVADEELIAVFEPSTRNEDGLRKLGTLLAAEFFWEKGFRADGFATSSPDLLKLLIANNVPVYVKQRLGSAYMPELLSTRIYIGYSDPGQYFIVHDNNFGNNHFIPYSEYEQISANQFVLAVMPTEYLVSNRPKVETASPDSYPARLGIMDDLALRDLQIKIMEVNWYKIDALLNQNNHVVAAVQTLEEILAHEAFNKLHPAARMSLSYDLTGFYMSEAPNEERAIEILETITLPLVEGTDFSEPYGEWDRKMDPSVYDQPFYTSLPWTRLGYLYLRTGDDERARSAFNKALEYHPNFQEAIDGLALAN